MVLFAATLLLSAYKNVNKIKGLLWVAGDIRGGHVPWGGIPVPYTATTRDWDFNTVNKDPPIRDFSSFNRYGSALI